MVTSVSHKRIVGYARVSTDRQAGDCHSSLETQEVRIRAVASDSDGLLVNVFCDVESGRRDDGLLVNVFCDVESGRRDDRPEYQRMVSYVLEEEIDVVLVQYLDRFGRNPKEILSRIWALKEHGVAVEVTGQDISEEMMLLVMAGMAGHESKSISERVRANMGNSIRKGTHSGKAPYGFRPVREIKEGRAVVVRWEIVESEAEIFREMARLSVEENLGFKAIADSPNEWG